MKRILARSEFGRNVLTLFTGSALAQAIPIVIAPILTRIYTPEEFGVFTLYMAIASIFGVIATGRYELAVMLPRKEGDSANITVLAILIALLISAIILLLVFSFNSAIVQLIGNVQIGPWLYLLPVSILFIGIHQALNYWNNRKKAFRQLALNRIIHSGGTAVGQVTLGYKSVFMGGGLIIGSLFGQLLSILTLAKMNWKDVAVHRIEIKTDSMVANAKIYKNFPLKDSWGALVNTAATHMPIFFITKIFGSALTGAFGLTFKVLYIPMALISGSISQVVYQKIVAIHNSQPELLFRFILKLFVVLLALSIPFVTIVAMFGYEIFIFVFGSNWTAAANFAIPLSFVVAVRFAVSPLSTVLSLNHNIGRGVCWKILYFFTLGTTLIAASDLSVDSFLIVFAIHEFILYGIYLAVILHATRVGPSKML